MTARFLRSGWSPAFDVGLLLLLVLLSSLVVIRTGLKPTDSSAGVAVVFVPWTDAETAISRATRAGGSLIRVGALPWIVVVVPEDGGYVERVLADGALAALDPQTLSDCAPILLPQEARRI
jgi:hypothetical protein